MTLPTLSSPDATIVRDAVRDCVTRLRTERVPDPMALAAELLPLATHASPSVRQAVAEACEFLGGPECDTTLTALLTDVDSYVMRAAERSTKRRATRRKTAAREDEQERVVAKILSDVESKYGKPARRLAERGIQRAREYFVSKLHHEVNKIATTLLFSNAAILAEVDKPTIDRVALRRHAKVANERGAFLLAVIASARAYATAVVPSFDEHRLAALVDQARGQLVDRLGDRGARVVFVNDVPASLSIDADAHALLQAFQNILQNAVEAYDESAEAFPLRVSATPLARGNEIALAFTDQGAGMSDEQKEHLFVPFGSTKPGGTGIGLLVARKMVEEVHGGGLSIESARGQGTTVTITIPVHQKGARAR